MITREQATATLADFEAAGLDGRIPDLARTVVALHDEVERLRAEVAKLPATVDQTVNLLRLAEASVSLLRADLDDTRASLDFARREREQAEAAEEMYRINMKAAELELRRLRAAEAPMPEVFAPASPADPEPFLLEVKPEWRQGRGRWWRGSASGYTNDWHCAGRYTVEDATDRGAFANHERFHAVSLETVQRAAVPGSV